MSVSFERYVSLEDDADKLPEEFSGGMKRRVEFARALIGWPFDDFQNSDSPLIKELVALDPHDHSADPYYPDPWDKRRKPKRDIL